MRYMLWPLMMAALLAFWPFANACGQGQGSRASFTIKDSAFVDFLFPDDSTSIEIGNLLITVSVVDSVIQLRFSGTNHWLIQPDQISGDTLEFRDVHPASGLDSLVMQLVGANAPGVATDSGAARLILHGRWSNGGANENWGRAILELKSYENRSSQIWFTEKGIGGDADTVRWKIYHRPGGEGTIGHDALYFQPAAGDTVVYITKDGYLVADTIRARTIISTPINGDLPTNGGPIFFARTQSAADTVAYPASATDDSIRGWQGSGWTVTPMAYHVGGGGYGSGEIAFTDTMLALVRSGYKNNFWNAYDDTMKTLFGISYNGEMYLMARGRNAFKNVLTDNRGAWLNLIGHYRENSQGGQSGYTGINLQNIDVEPDDITEQAENAHGANWSIRTRRYIGNPIDNRLEFYNPQNDDTVIFTPSGGGHFYGPTYIDTTLTIGSVDEQDDTLNVYGIIQVNGDDVEGTNYDSVNQLISDSIDAFSGATTDFDSVNQLISDTIGDYEPVISTTTGNNAVDTIDLIYAGLDTANLRVARPPYVMNRSGSVLMGQESSLSYGIKSTSDDSSNLRYGFNLDGQAPSMFSVYGMGTSAGALAGAEDAYIRIVGISNEGHDGRSRLEFANFHQSDGASQVGENWIIESIQDSDTALVIINKQLDTAFVAYQAGRASHTRIPNLRVDSVTATTPVRYSELVNFSEWYAYPGYAPDRTRDSILVTVTTCSLTTITGHTPAGSFFHGMEARGDTGEIHLDSLQSIDLFSPVMTVPFGYSELDSVVMYYSMSASADTAKADIELFTWNDGTLTQVAITNDASWNVKTEATAWSGQTTWDSGDTDTINRLTKFQFRIRPYVLNNAEYVRFAVECFYH